MPLRCPRASECAAGPKSVEYDIRSALTSSLSRLLVYNRTKAFGDVLDTVHTAQSVVFGLTNVASGPSGKRLYVTFPIDDVDELEELPVYPVE